MVQLILGTGSNSGDRFSWLSMMREELEARIGQIILVSSIVESPPWGYASQNWFLNQVIALETNRSPRKVLAEIHGIESGFGRMRSENYTDRNADIDILFYGQELVNLPGLQIPHPHLASRRFVLMPLAEILPDFIDPASGNTIQVLLDHCPDQGECRWYNGS